MLIPKLGDVVTWLPDYSWFLGCGLGFVTYYFLAKAMGVGESSIKPVASETTSAATA